MMAQLAGAGAIPRDTAELSLAEAVEKALSSNPALRAARADARFAAQQPLEASRAFLPSVRVDVMGMRTTDPVAVFGLKLRQANFAGQDLQLDPLNDPAAYGGFTTAATVEMPILAPEGLFGYTAARRAASAQAAGARRQAGATVFLVSRAYWDAQLAARRLQALDTALASARAHQAQAEALRDQGMVTGLDARLAALGAAEVEVRRVAASAEAANALSRLRALLAIDHIVGLVLTDTLGPVAPSPCADATSCSQANRGDLAAVALGAAAADAAVKRAWASQLPQLAAFGTVARHSRATPWGEGSGDWTIGIGIRWNVFPALGGLGAIRGARAARDAARARADEATREATLETLQAARTVDAARQAVAIASDAAEEADTALTQARLRYRTGAAPITELLDVQTAATNATLNLLAARRDLLVAQAALEFAYGVHDK